MAYNDCSGDERTTGAYREHRPTVEGLEARSLLSVAHHVHAPRVQKLPKAYLQTNLVSDFPAGVEGVNAQIQDTNLLNPWGLVSSTESPFWVSDQVSGVSTLYSVSSTGTVSKVPLTVTIPSMVSQPSHGFNPLTGPTGIVFNSDPNATDFTVNGYPAYFIFATLEGTIAAWNYGTTAQIKAGPVSGEEFTGLAIANSGGHYYLYTADPRFPNGIDVFDSNFTKATLPGENFVVPTRFVHPGFSPYNIQNINGDLFVTYVTPATGGGYVDEFDTSGNFIRQFAGNGSRGPLQSPWGLALAPSDFGRFSNDLLVGNFGDGRINAYNFQTGKFEGQLTDPRGNPIVIPFLWALDFGNGRMAGPTNTLFFTAGIAGQFHGLFGSLQAVHRSS